MPLIGPDIHEARMGSLYAAATRQPWWLAALIAAGVFGIYSFIQVLFGGFIFGALFGMPDLANPDFATTEDFLKAIVIGITPSAVLALLLTWWAAGWVNPSVDGRKDRGLPLHLPALGILGWALTILGFIVLMYMVFFLVYTILGIDPREYMPRSDGGESSAGLVEKAIASMTNQPLLFALALPGIAVGAPVVEEFLFRGALFSALRQTKVGNVGAVVLTAAAWALIHGSAAPWLFVGLLFLMGIALGYALLRFGSLWVPIILHCVWNSLVSLAFLSGAGLQ